MTPLRFASATGPELFADLNERAAPSLAFAPWHHEVAGGLLYFSANDGAHGNEPWRTDGTAEGTRLIRDLSAGPSESGPQSFAALGSRLAFTTFEEPGLWITDGTAEGTEPLCSASCPIVLDLVSLGDRVVFTVAETGQGTSLWTSDGTVAGTTLVLPHAPEAPILRYGLAAVASRAYFVVAPAPLTAEQERVELWRTDGTPASTRLVHDRVARGCCSTRAPVLERANEAWFLATAAAGDLELWRDSATPVRVTALGIATATAFSGMSSGIELGGALIWTMYLGGPGTPQDPSTLELWRTDATAGGTARISILPSLAGAPAMTAFGNRAFFPLYDLYSQANYGYELWATDGTTAGTGIALDLVPGPGSSSPREVLEWHGQLYFLAEIDGRPTLYRSDGTVAGTQVIVTLGANVAPPVPAPSWLAPLDDRLLFFGWDAENGSALWSSDGTPGGTGFLHRLDPEHGASSDPTQFLRLGDSLFVTATDGETGRQLWRVDEESQAAERVTELGTAERRPFLLHTLGAAGGKVVLYENGGERLLAFDPGSGESQELPRLSINYLEPTATLDKLLVLGGSELARTDGTAAGTFLLGDFTPGECQVTPRVRIPCPSDATSLTRFGRHIYYSARSSWGRELFRTDGTVEGTTLVADLWPNGGGSEPHHLTAVDDRLYFVASTPPSSSPELWYLEAGASDPRRGVPRSFNLAATAAFRGRLVVSELANEGAPELWLTDGTEVGSTLLYRGESGWAPPRTLIPSGDRLLFAARGESGVEPWVSDGTIEGTRPLRDIAVGPASSLPNLFHDRSLRPVDGVFTFAASDGPTGGELWSSDPDALDALFLGDLDDGPSSAYPAELTPLGDRVFFAARRADVGRELFAIDRSAFVRTCRESAATLCLHGGRFAVSVDWLDRTSGAKGRAGAVPRTEETGLFWFFEEDNLELAVKVLDGRSLTGSFWVYYGALTDVEYWVTVVDSVTGRSRTLHSAQGTVCGRGDVHALPDQELVVGLASPAPVRAAGPRAEPAKNTRSAAAACDPMRSLCLHEGRFAVDVIWRDPNNGVESPASPIPDTDLTGAFWFFEPTNLELLVKVLDGRTINGRFWVYFGGLSDVAYEIRVTDTSTGATRAYRNPPGTLCGRADVEAF